MKTQTVQVETTEEDLNLCANIYFSSCFVEVNTQQTSHLVNIPPPPPQYEERENPGEKGVWLGGKGEGRGGGGGNPAALPFIYGGYQVPVLPPLAAW